MKVINVELKEDDGTHALWHGEKFKLKICLHHVHPALTTRNSFQVIESRRGNETRGCVE